MPRIIEYIALISCPDTFLDEKKYLDTESFEAEVKQRFPLSDHLDYAFPDGLPVFCLPAGWKVNDIVKKPCYYTNVLTSGSGSYSYCVTISWNESVSDDVNLKRYIPKCLVLVSQFPFTRKFKDCLSLLYFFLRKESNFDVEKALAILLATPNNISYGVEDISLNLEGISINFEFPIIKYLNYTEDSVYFLATQIGIDNMTKLLTALLLDHKILFISNCYNSLYKGCQGLSLLIFPLKFSFVYIPVLPSSLMEVTSAPTPFMIGCSKKCSKKLTELNDVVFVDLDIGSVLIPKSLDVPKLPGFWLKPLLKDLSNILYPELKTGDHLFPVVQQKNHIFIDKKLRAAVMYFLIELLDGYYSALTVVRLFPRCIVRFQNDVYVEKRKLQGCNFFKKFLMTTLFNSFIEERGVPYRICDIFDKINSERSPFIRYGSKSREETIERITKILVENERTNYPINLFDNEKVKDQFKKLIVTPQVSFKTIAPKIFEDYYNKIKKQNVTLKKHDLVEEYTNPKMVPEDFSFISSDLIYTITYINKSILSEFLKYIFSMNFAKSRQLLPKIKNLIQNIGERIFFCNELELLTNGQAKKVEEEQFEILGKVFDFCLLRESNTSPNSSSVLIMNLSCLIYKNLNNGKQIFLFNSIQEHIFWKINMYWESYFFIIAQSYLINFYLKDHTVLKLFEEKTINFSTVEKEMDNEIKKVNTNPEVYAIVLHPFFNHVTLASRVFSERIEQSKRMSDDNKNMLKKLEEELITKLINEFTSKVISLKFGLKDLFLLPKKNISGRNNTLDFNSSKNKESLSSSFFSGFTSEDFESIENQVTELIASVSTACDISYDVLTSTQNSVSIKMKNIYELFESMYYDNFKNKLLMIKSVVSPHLFSKEKVISCIDCILLPSSIYDKKNEPIMYPQIYPAKGLLYHTSYRLLFYGNPISDTTSDIIISRSIPHGLINQIKAGNLSSYATGTPFSYVENIMNSQITYIRKKNSTVVILGFPEYLSSDKIENFLKLIRQPFNQLLERLSLYSKLFDLEGKDFGKNEDGQNTQEVEFDLKKDRNKSLKKNTLNKVKKLLKDNSNINTGGKSDKMNDPRIRSKTCRTDTEEISRIVGTQSARIENQYESNFNVKNVNFSSHNLFLYDYERMGLTIDVAFKATEGKVMNPWRITTINLNNNPLFPSLPNLFVVPMTVTDDQLLKIGKYYKFKRLPVLCWQLREIDNETSFCYFGGALLRGSSILKSISSLFNLNKTGVTTSMNDIESYLYLIHHTALSFKIPKKMGTDVVLSGLNPFKYRKSTYDKILLSEQGEDYNYTEQSYIFSDFYIFGDKNFPKGVSSDQTLSVLQCDLPDSNNIKSAFSKLSKSFFREKNATNSVNEYLNLLNSSKWLSHLSLLLEISSTLAFLIETQEAYCLSGLGDGSEVSCQVSSLTQVMLDPFYRTVKGFIILVEKEWVTFKHRFIYRSGLISSNHLKFVPYFLQFLDCVHQLLFQFPNSFEFNDYFLKYIAYHYLSNRFSNFLLSFDMMTEEEVSATLTESPITKKDSSLKKNAQQKRFSTMFGNKTESFTDLFASNDDELWSESIWEHIINYSEKSVIFYNVLHINGLNKVLYPSNHIAHMDVWDYYYSWNDFNDFSFDLEIINQGVMSDSFQLLDTLLYRGRTNVKHPDLITMIDSENFEFSDGFPGLGYQIPNTLIESNKFIKKIQDFIPQFSIYEIIEKITVTAPNKMIPNLKGKSSKESSKLKLPTNVEAKDFNNTYVCYNIKKVLLKLLEKTKPYKYDKKNDKYFRQMMHKFVELNAFETLICYSCNKPISYKSIYFICEYCSLFLHVKCSKSVDPICNIKQETSQTTIEYSAGNKTLEKSIDRKNSSLFKSSRSGYKLNKAINLKLPNEEIFASLRKRNNSNPQGQKNFTNMTKGYLVKCKKKSKLKFKNYFILDLEKKKLLIYHDINDISTKPEKEIISLSTLIKCQLININTENNKIKEVEKDNNECPTTGFELIFSDQKTIKFVSPTKKETEIWISQMSKIFE